MAIKTVNTWRRLLSIAGVASLAVLAACGGGSGGGGASTAAAPSISSQPSSISAVSGNSAAFSVTAAGDGLALQWQRSTDSAVTWANIASAVSASYSIASVDTSLSGYQYRVVVTGTAATLVSSPATLTVTPVPAPPAITVQPADQSIVSGTNASFSVTATGTSLAYQWQSTLDGTTWTNIAGATSATLTLTSVALSDSGKRYRVVMSNALGTIASNSAVLSVSAAPTAPAIVTQPVAASVVTPGTASFSVTATGNPAPTYQWQQSTDRGLTYADISGATASSTTTPATTPLDDGKFFRVRVFNSIASVISDGVRLTVMPTPMAPVVTAQPLGQTIVAAATATYSVVATGAPTPTYQWMVSIDGGVTFTTINGATAATYTTPITTVGDDGKRYRVMVTNSVGTVTSAAATLSVGTLTLAGYPDGLALASNGDIYVCVDVSFGGVLKVHAGGIVTTLAGGLGAGLVDGTGTAARFNAPAGAAIDSSGNVFVADGPGHVIRKVTSAGVVTTFAGNGTAGLVDGTGNAAQFTNPIGLAFDGGGNLYVTDGNAIRRVTPSAVVTTLTGSASSGFLNGPLATARFNNVEGIVVDGLGTIYVTDSNNQAIRVVSAGTVSTLAGPLTTLQGYLAMDSGGTLYAETTRSVLRVSSLGVVTTLAGGSGTGFVDGTGNAASFNYPRGLAVDSGGNVYVSDILNKAIRKITPAGTVTTLVH